jgi:hypothetical protein
VKTVNSRGQIAYREQMSTLSRARLLVVTTAAALVVPLGASAPSAGTPAAAVTAELATPQPPARQISYHQWANQRQLSRGTFTGTRAVRGVLELAKPVGTRSYDDPHGYRTKRYAFGRWASPWREAGFAFDQLIPSWDATTPGDSWIQVQVRGRSESGRVSKWYTMANWAGHDRKFHRRSLGSQADNLAQVDVDTLKTRYSMGFTTWQVRLTLLRKDGTKAVPRVDTIGAMTSSLPAADRVRTSRPGVASGISLKLPRYSQMIHQGHYPEYDAGGEAWCSPTSVSMVLGSLGRLPSQRAYSWVPAGHPNPWVDHAARTHYDYGYDGAGNWSFSAAYAASRADSAFVTRLRNLREAERFIKAGIPLVASVKFGPGELTGSPIRSTNGHLLVIAGFTESGDVVVNDPAAPKNRGVRRVYKRGEFENAWIPKSGGLVYVIRNHGTPLPKSSTQNW